MNDPDWLVPVLLALTSGATYWIGSRRLRLRPRALGGAAARALEAIGATLVFFTANAALSVLTVLALRASTASFLSLHRLPSWTLLVLSLLQALVFQAWRDSKASQPPPAV
jgi:hypothetical protein